MYLAFECTQTSYVIYGDTQNFREWFSNTRTKFSAFYTKNSIENNMCSI